MALDTAGSAAQPIPPAEARESAVVRFAGDSGDGMQLTGSQFTLATRLAGNALATFPDYPAEIRAPQGSTFGVSAFQINFGSVVHRNRWRPTRRADRDEPGGAQGEPARFAPRRPASSPIPALSANAT